MAPGEGGFVDGPIAGSKALCGAQDGVLPAAGTSR